MAVTTPEPRPFDTFFPKWNKWVQQRRAVWSHLHLAGILLWKGDGWGCICASLILADTENCESPAGVHPHWPTKVCAFRVAVPFERLDEIVEGLRAGQLAADLVPGIKDKITFHGAQGRKLEPNGDPRMEYPDFSSQPASSDTRWPRYTIEMQAGPLNEWLGQENYHQFEKLDDHLGAKGFGRIPELAWSLGIGRQTDHFSSMWTTSSTLKLVAPLFVRIESAKWDEGALRERFTYPLELEESQKSWHLGDLQDEHAPAWPLGR
jgi:hypothetical protein